jgi:hypothetical protein
MGVAAGRQRGGSAGQWLDGARDRGVSEEADATTGGHGRRRVGRRWCNVVPRLSVGTVRGKQSGGGDTSAWRVEARRRRRPRRTAVAVVRECHIVRV